VDEHISGLEAGESLLGAVASGAGDDFHYRWVAREVLRLLDPGSHVIAIKVEGLPNDEVHASLGEHGQAVDVTLTLDVDGAKARRYLQLKYSPSHPAVPWTWARLLQPRAKTKPQSSVLAKLAGLMAGIDFAGEFSIVTNQPLADEVARDVAALRESTAAAGSALAGREAELRKKLRLEGEELRRFLASWDLDGFEAASRLDMQTEVIKRLADTTDADARTDAASLQQHIVELMLPEGIRSSELTRETILVWLGAGAEEIFFPAPSRIVPPVHVVYRAVADALVARLRAPLGRPLRLHANGGCGKTSLVATLAPSLPTGSELFVYDSYGGGLFLASDQRRHLPGHAFTQIGNELAGRLRTPFVIRRNESLDAFTAFKRRVAAASEIIAARSPDALLVIAFDAVDNARIGADHWTESCFLDPLAAASGWPDNVRILVTCRNARLDKVGAADLYEDFAVGPFEPDETQALVERWQPTWPPSLAATLHDLTGGNPRRLTYALDGLRADQAKEAVQRLLPRAAGIDPLFAKLVEEAGVRLGGATRIWPMLSALARLPRPVPAAVLAALAGLEIGDVGDIAADVGGITCHPEGWSFHDEDFEGFVDAKTADGAAKLLTRAADLLLGRAETDIYAARAVGEVLANARRLEALYALVTQHSAMPAGLSAAETEYIRSRRLALAVRACRADDDITTAAQLLIASAEATKRQQLLDGIIAGNLDLSIRFEPETVMRLVMTGARFRKRRGGYRIERAAELAIADPIAARNHFRWWREYLREFSRDTDSVDLAPENLAAEYHYVRLLRDHSTAISNLMRWHPLPFVGRAFNRLASDHAGRCLEPFLEAIELRRWPPQALAPLMAAALLAGGTFDMPVLKKALGRLATASEARWAKPFEERVRTSPILAWHEATLFLCERAAAFPALHGTIATILAKAFPYKEPRERYELSRICSGAARHARVLALHEILTGTAIDLDRWLPPAREVPKKAPDRPRRYGEERNKTSEENWNEARSDTKYVLAKILDAARASLSLVIGKETSETAWAAFHAALDMRHVYDQRPREDDAALLIVRVHLLHRCLAGGDITALRTRVIELLSTWSAASPGFQLDLARSLALTPAGHDAALDWLVALGRLAETEPASASQRSEQQIDYARAALPLDLDLAKHFFAQAIASTEHVDTEALSEIAAARAIANSGVDGSHAERLDLAQRLGDAAGSVVAALDLRGDFDWSVTAGAIAEIDLGAGLAAVSRWHDVGVADFGYTIPDLLSTRAARALSSTQRYALSLLAGGDEPGLGQLFEGETVPEAILAHALDRKLRAGGATAYLDTLNDVAALPETERSPARRAGEARRQLFLSWREPNPTNQSASETTKAAARPLADQASIRAALRAAHTDADRYRDPPYGELAARIAARQLRVPFLDMALEAAGDDGRFGFALPEILEGWRDYPPVEQWARARIGSYVARSLRRLFPWRYEDTEEFEALLAATGLGPLEQAEIILDAIAENAEQISSELLFALVGLIAARIPTQRRNGLLATLLDRVVRRADHAPQVGFAGDAVPPDAVTCLARLFFAAMADVDRSVRWRATHAVRLLAEADDPVLARLIDCLAAEDEPIFSSRDFYLYAAREQLMIALWRAVEAAPQALAPFASQILAHLRSTTHLIVREAGRALLLGLADAGAAQLAIRDREWLAQLNRSALPMAASPRRAWPTRSPAQRKERAFHFDDTDTIPYWYRRPADLFGLPMEDFLDRVERWVHCRWGYGEKTGWWEREPRLDRIRAVAGGTSHRHGTRPAIERLSRYLEWHGMMCAVGELIDTCPLVRDRYGDSFDEWRDRSLPTLAPVWLSDLRTPAPMEPRFWGYAPAADLERSELEESPDTDPWPRSVVDAVFDEEITAADDSIVIASDFTLRWEDRTQNVDIRSALVTPDTAAALAQALLTARDRMDFLVPGAGEHSEADMPDYRFIGWLRFDQHEATGDRPDEARGLVEGLAVAPDEKRTGGLSLHFDRMRSTFLDADARNAVDLAMWGEEEAPHGHGWRATTSAAFLDRLVDQTGMSLLICAEISRRRHHGSEPSRTRWALWLYEAGRGLRRIRRTRRGLGPWLVHKAGLDRSTDIPARWLLHRAAELDLARVAADSTEERVRLEAQVAAICAAFRGHQQNPDRWEEGDFDDF
jgi:hypothetical protein